jgi:hypothetical protein
VRLVVLSGRVEDAVDVGDCENTGWVGFLPSSVHLVIRSRGLISRSVVLDDLGIDDLGIDDLAVFSTW